MKYTWTTRDWFVGTFVVCTIMWIYVTFYNFLYGVHIDILTTLNFILRVGR